MTETEGVDGSGSGLSSTADVAMTSIAKKKRVSHLSTEKFLVTPVYTLAALYL